MLQKESLEKVRGFAGRGCPVSARARIWKLLLLGRHLLDSFVCSSRSVLHSTLRPVYLISSHLNYKRLSAYITV